MSVESLEQLKSAFEEWRGQKKHRRDPTPVKLIEKARAAARVHGAAAVVEAVKIDYRHLDGSDDLKKRREARAATTPSYSRVELTALSASKPVAELEMPNGVKLRLYSQTPEILTWMSSVCATRGAR